MNDSIANATSVSSVDISELIHIAYINYVANLVPYATLSLLVYTVILAIPQDMIYMWLSPRPFSIPNLLYAFTRYASIFAQAFELWLLFVPPGSLCTIAVYATNVAITLGYIGVQGLLIARAYSLCRGNKVVAVILALSFGGGLAAILCEIIIAKGCQSLISLKADLAGNICTTVTDLVVFGILLWKIWDTWKLKRETGIHSHNDLVSVILKQTMSRFCFVIIFTTALTIVVQFDNDIAIDIAGVIQHSLSVVLVADFMLDLRQKNSGAIQAANISLPTIQIRSVANYIHQSILVELGDHESSVHVMVEENDDLSTGSPDVQVGIGFDVEASA